MNHPSFRCWLLLAIVDDTVLVEVVSTAHPEGPRGHVPDRCASSVEDSDAWLVDHTWGVTGVIDHVEIREMEAGWNPVRWD